MKLLTAFFAGSVFAVGLAVSGMTQPDKVIAFLTLGARWDPSLGLVMVGAIAAHLALFKLILRRPSPIYGAQFGIPTRTDITPRLVAGAGLFGVGWALGGFCPGPALTALGSGAFDVALFVAAMAAGMALFHLWDRPRAQPIPEPGHLPQGSA